jgi:hypothetical protein
VENSEYLGKFEDYLQNPNRESHGPLQYWKGDQICDAIGRTRHILDNRLVAGEITAIYGPPKVGKTHVAIACAVACATGGEFWGVKFPQEGSKVVYVAAERHEQAALRLRAHSVRLGFKEIPENIVLVGGFPIVQLGDENLIQHLRNLVKEVSPSIVVFDTYVRMTDNNEDSSRDADNNIGAFTEIIRQSRRDCAGLLVHHAGKDGGKKMRGSNALLAAVTTVWKVFHKGTPKKICLSMEDANMLGEIDPCYFEIVQVSVPALTTLEEDEEVGIAVSVANGTSIATREEQILRIMKDADGAGLAIEEITERVVKVVGPCSASTLRRILGVLTDRGDITQSRSGKKVIYSVSI